MPWRLVVDPLSEQSSGMCFDRGGRSVSAIVDDRSKDDVQRCSVPIEPERVWLEYRHGVWHVELIRSIV